MVEFVDIPGRAIRYLCAAVPSAPDDPDRYTSLSITMDRQHVTHSVAFDGFWMTLISASWCGSDGNAELSLEVPLRVLLSDEYTTASEMMEPLW